MIDTKKLTVSASPHQKSADTTTGIMRDVIIALVPAGIAAVLVFGLRALAVIVVSVVSCVLAEFLSRKAMKKEDTITDLSAVVTGLLLAYNLPSNIPFWIVVLGAVIAIVVIKQMFGGIGQNFINPALGARVILMSRSPAECPPVPSQDSTNPAGTSTLSPVQLPWVWSALTVSRKALPPCPSCSSATSVDVSVKSPPSRFSSAVST